MSDLKPRFEVQQGDFLWFILDRASGDLVAVNRRILSYNTSEAAQRKADVKNFGMALSNWDRNILRHGAHNSHGIISHPMGASNFDKPEKRMAKLVAAGLATPSAHGDWYITETGRKAIT